MKIVIGTYEGLLYGWEGTVHNGENGKKSLDLKLTYGYAAHSGCIKSVSLMKAKNGDILTTGGSDEVIKIYNVKKRVEVGTLMQHNGSITCMEYFGHTHLLSGSTDNTICIWRTSDWNCLHILGGHKGEINSIAVHPSGKLALSVARDRTLRMWNLVKGRSAYIRRLDQEASSVILSDDGNKYALIMGKKIVVFCAGTGELVGTIECSKTIHSATFIHNKYIACGGEDKTISVWTCSGKLLRMASSEDITSRIREMKAISGENYKNNWPFLVIATSTGLVQVWDIADFNLVSQKDTDKDNVQIDQTIKPLAQSNASGGTRITCLSACATTN